MMKASNTFLITTSGMTVFFTIGALESKITDASYKISFVSTMLTSSLGYYLYAGMGTESTKAGAINLSASGAGLVTLGLTGSFIATYVMHELGMDKGGSFELDKIWLFKLSIIGSTALLSGGSVPAIITSVILTDIVINYVDLTELEQIEILGYNVMNMISLSVATTAKLSTENYEDAVMAISRISAVSFAKANAVTGVEIASDYKGTICSYPLIDKVCDLLGITETLAEV